MTHNKKIRTSVCLKVMTPSMPVQSFPSMVDLLMLRHLIICTYLRATYLILIQYLFNKGHLTPLPTSVCLKVMTPSIPVQSFPSMADLLMLLHLTDTSPSAPFFLTTGIRAVPTDSFTSNPRRVNEITPGSGEILFIYIDNYLCKDSRIVKPYIIRKMALGFFAVGHFAMGQFAVRKKKPNLT